jgi:hypothetical protein
MRAGASYTIECFGYQVVESLRDGRCKEFLVNGFWFLRFEDRHLGVWQEPRNVTVKAGAAL